MDANLIIDLLLEKVKQLTRENVFLQANNQVLEREKHEAMNIGQQPVSEVIQHD